jgi:nucleoside permease NupC
MKPTDSWQFNSMTKLSTKPKEEFFALLPPTIFFFVALHIVAFVRVLHELVRVIGKEKVLRIFFGPIPIPQV